ncbi:MAG: hypothetical protein L3J44_03325 [Campylobacteraceae bacterium]|nr:hypothetical protein [Campylobacteraceae bacterium]
MKGSVLYRIFPFVIFAIGILFYYFFREPTIVEQWLNIEDIHIYSHYIHYFNSFPSFVHVFFFSILTWLVLEKSYENISILFWLVLNLLLEIGQMLVDKNATQSYIFQGTYSHWDIIFILIGALAAKIYIKFF